MNSPSLLIIRRERLVIMNSFSDRLSRLSRSILRAGDILNSHLAQEIANRLKRIMKIDPLGPGFASIDCCSICSSTSAVTSFKLFIVIILVENKPDD